MTFDPESFMQTTVDQPMATEFEICPAGEYQAMVDDFDSKAFSQIDFTYKQGDRAGQPGTMTKFNCPFIINDDAVKAALGREKVVCDMQMIVDIGADGGLDFGPNKNVNLGKLRDAVGQNSAGAWSPSQLRGAGPVMVKVTHNVFKRKDGTEGKRAEVTRVARIS